MLTTVKQILAVVSNFLTTVLNVLRGQCTLECFSQIKPIFLYVRVTDGLMTCPDAQL